MIQELVLSKLGHTWILDLDGTIVKHNGYKIDGYDTLLPGVLRFLECIPHDDMVVFITSREIRFREQTEEFLKSNHIHYDYIIYEAPYGERILINDNKPSGLSMSKAVALQRNQGIDLRVRIDEKL